MIDHSKFNQNHLSIKEAINDRVPVPSNCSTNQIIKYDGGGWVCTDMPADGADGAPGAPGADGADGAAGPAGADGADGLPGEDGLPGMDGLNGIDGRTEW